MVACIDTPSDLERGALTQPVRLPTNGPQQCAPRACNPTGSHHPIAVFITTPNQVEIANTSSYPESVQPPTGSVVGRRESLAMPRWSSRSRLPQQSPL